MSATAAQASPDQVGRLAVPRPAFWPMVRTNIVLGVTVLVCWFIFGGDRAIHAITTEWRVSLTMVFGSLVGGGTSEGGGAVGFPVLTKVLAVPAGEARLVHEDRLGDIARCRTRRGDGTRRGSDGGASRNDRRNGRRSGG